MRAGFEAEASFVEDAPTLCFVPLEEHRQMYAASVVSSSQVNTGLQLKRLYGFVLQMRRSRPNSGSPFASFCCRLRNLPTGSTPLSSMNSTRCNRSGRSVRVDQVFNLMPSPVSFSSMNSMPLTSSAARIFLTVSPRPPNSPSVDSSLAIVGSEMPECRARSDWDHPSSALSSLLRRTSYTRLIADGELDAGGLEGAP